MWGAYVNLAKLAELRSLAGAADICHPSETEQSASLNDASALQISSFSLIAPLAVGFGRRSRARGQVREHPAAGLDCDLDLVALKEIRFSAAVLIMISGSRLPIKPPNGRAVDFEDWRFTSARAIYKRLPNATACLVRTDGTARLRRHIGVAAQQLHRHTGVAAQPQEP